MTLPGLTPAPGPSPVLRAPANSVSSALIVAIE